MTTTAEQDVKLQWDAFFKEEGAGLRNMRQHVDVFRKMEWPAIVRLLNREYDIVVPDGLEPHWVTPGKAVYWQHNVVEKPMLKREEGGRMVREVEVIDKGWFPTNPLPASNASAVAGYLRKGFRLRPPSDGVDEKALEAAVLTAEPQQESLTEQRIFRCDRHGLKVKGFSTWRGYLRHCQRYQEAPAEEPPRGLKQRIKKYKWYCFLHNIGFKSYQSRLATLHVRQELRRPAQGVHPGLEQMEVQRG